MHSIFNYCIPSIEIPNYVQKIYGNIRVPMKTYYNKLKCSFSYQFQIELLEKGHILLLFWLLNVKLFWRSCFLRRPQNLTKSSPSIWRLLDGEDFVNFWGLLRKHELYSSLLTHYFTLHTAIVTLKALKVDFENFWKDITTKLETLV